MRLLNILILSLLAAPCLAQESCSKSKLLGRWDRATRLVYQTFNLDSLLANLNTLPVDSTTQSFYFKLDNSCFSTVDSGRIFDKSRFLFVEERCEVLFGKKPHRKLAWHIILLNEKHLVARYETPKAEFVMVCRRKQ